MGHDDRPMAFFNESTWVKKYALATEKIQKIKHTIQEKEQEFAIKCEKDSKMTEKQRAALDEAVAAAKKSEKAKIKAEARFSAEKDNLFNRLGINQEAKEKLTMAEFAWVRDSKRAQIETNALISQQSRTKNEQNELEITIHTLKNDLKQAQSEFQVISREYKGSRQMDKSPAILPQPIPERAPSPHQILHPLQELLAKNQTEHQAGSSIGRVLQIVALTQLIMILEKVLDEEQNSTRIDSILKRLEKDPDYPFIAVEANKVKDMFDQKSQNTPRL